MSKNLTRKVITTAIEKGLSYLAQSQRATGEFATYTSPRLDMTGGKERPQSVYVTTFVIHALSHLPPSPIGQQIQGQAGEFLIRQQEENGSWHYDGRFEPRTIPQDLDDTSCAVAALLQLGRRPDFSYYALLWQNEAAPGGPHYTWIGVNHSADHPLAQEVDVLINANILFCGSLLDISLPGTASYLKQVIREEAYQARTKYFSVSPHFTIYTLGRAYRDGAANILSPAMPPMIAYILTKLPPPQAQPPAFHLACLATTLLNLEGCAPDFRKSGQTWGDSGGIPPPPPELTQILGRAHLEAPLSLVSPYLTALLDQQQGDGHWPAWAVYLTYGRLYDGAPALTTALALEGLGKYLKLSGL